MMSGQATNAIGSLLRYDAQGAARALIQTMTRKDHTLFDKAYLDGSEGAVKG